MHVHAHFDDFEFVAAAAVCHREAERSPGPPSRVANDGDVAADDLAANGTARLLGVEYITPLAAWNASHPELPLLEGQHLQIVGAPNRYRLDPFYELHVWAWRDNPNGTFVDWNPRVSCEGQ